MRDHLNAVLVDRYAIDRQIGRGGMATVWLARDLRHDRLVAIKVMEPELAGAIGADRFLREIRLTARLQHPNIIPVLDSGALPPQNGVSIPWSAMPYIAGESLRERISRERELPIEDALRITEEAAGALRAAHLAGIVHRDIKPENLLLAGGHVFVADFGIGKALTDTVGQPLTSTGVAVGTFAYMSPEQATADTVDARSDQYSLGCVLYEMLVGEPPFTGPTAQAVVARRLAEPARAIHSVRSAVPASLEAAVLRSLERIPADRFPDISAFATALRKPGASMPPWRTSRAKLAVRVAAAAVIVALSAWAISHRRAAAQPARSPEVIALYQRGMRGYDERTPEGVRDAIIAFTAAVHRDSTYVAAWDGLAKAYVRAYERRFVFPGFARDSVLHLAVTAVNRAMAEDPSNADVWVTQAIVSRDLDPTDVAPAIRSLRQALRLDSSLAPAWHFLASDLEESGKPAEALAAWRRSVAADPSYTQGLAFLGLGHYWHRQNDSAMRWADSAIAVNPNYLLGRSTVGYVGVERGEFARAAAAFEAARRLGTDVEVVNSVAGSALVAARAGNIRQARDLLARAESLAVPYSPAPLHTAVYMAHAYAALPDRTRALTWLRRYTPVEDLHFQLHLRCDPPFDALRSDPGFASLVVFKPPSSGGC